MLAWRLAWRDLEGASGGFRLLALALVLAVAAIAAVGSIADALRDEARGAAREAVGGDLSFRLFHRPPSVAERGLLESFGDLALIAELRPRATRLDGSRGSLVELKAIDDAYPLYGRLVLDPPVDDGESPARALGAVGGSFGAAVDAELLQKLDLAIGDRLRLGALEVEIRARLVAEPDRAFRAFALGPRIVVNRQALDASGLAAPGAAVYWYSRLRLAEGVAPGAVIRTVEGRLPHAGWRIVDAAEGIPGIERSLALGRALLAALALAILVIGGVGIAGAVTAHLERKTATIAILKTLGATGGFTRRLYLGQLGITALAATASGLAIGAAVSALFGLLAADVFGRTGSAALLQPAALATAAGMGLVTTLLFAILPLARAAQTPPSLLLRSLITRPRLRRPLLPFAAMGTLAFGLAGLVAARSAVPLVSFAVLLALFALLGLFWGWGRLVVALARRLHGRLGHAPLCRLALAEAGRPGATTAATIAALALGLTALSTVVTVERLATRHLAATLPASAPELVVIDLDPADAATLERFVADHAGIERARSVPFLHSRVTHLKGRPVHAVAVPRDVAWVIRGDRGLSWPTPEAAAAMAWVDAPEALPAASLEKGVAARLGLGLGDRLTIDLLGRPYEVRVGAFHEVDWTGLDLAFPILLAPPADPPPHRRIAALWLAPGALPAAVIEDLALRFPAAPVIEVETVLAALGRLLGAITGALAVVSGLTLGAAALVLAGGVAAGYRRRSAELAMLQVLGAVRRQRRTSGALELGLLGLAASLPASLAGALAARVVVMAISPEAWHFDPLIPLAVVGAATLSLAALGSLAAPKPAKTPALLT